MEKQSGCPMPSSPPCVERLRGHHWSWELGIAWRRAEEGKEEKGFLQVITGAVGATWMMLPMVPAHQEPGVASHPHHCTPCSAVGDGVCYPLGTGTALLLHGQCWCDHPGLRTGPSQGLPSWSTTWQGRRSHAEPQGSTHPCQGAVRAQGTDTGCWIGDEHHSGGSYPGAGSSFPLEKQT